VRLITQSGQQDCAVVDILDAHRFVILSDTPLANLFVFGKKVNDFRNLDYNAISMLGISAIQQLSRELKQAIENL
jgi:hypothetical protein